MPHVMPRVVIDYDAAAAAAVLAGLVSAASSGSSPDRARFGGVRRKRVKRILNFSHLER